MFVILIVRYLIHPQTTPGLWVMTRQSWWSRHLIHAVATAILPYRGEEEEEQEQEEEGEEVSLSKEKIGDRHVP